MPALMANAMISYGPCLNDFTLPFHFDGKVGTNAEWDLPVFPVSIPYTFNCVALSGGVVATSQQIGSVAAVAIADEIPLNRAMADLRAVVGAIRDVQTLEMAADLNDLLTRAVQSQGQPSNIEEWAHQLAADISNLAD